MTAVKLPHHFSIGCASSALQSEGSVDLCYPNNWMHWFDQDPSRFYEGVGPYLTNDFYRHFKEDIQMMAEIGLQQFRFSFQWGRLIENIETGAVSEKGLLFYKDVISELKKHNIEPMVCLSHFDMPQLCQDLGGFASSEVREYFRRYAQSAFEHFNKDVDCWFTFNEPTNPVYSGYVFGGHPPDKKNQLKEAMKHAFGVAISHAQAVDIFRSLSITGKIGIVVDINQVYPATDQVQDVQAAQVADWFLNRIFLDPAVLGKFDENFLSFLCDHDLMPLLSPEDLRIIEKNRVDLCGVNYYFPNRIQRSQSFDRLDSFSDFYQKYDWPLRRMNPYRGWEIYPQAVFDIAMDMKDKYGNIPWFIAENGMGVQDEERFLKEGIIEDDYRIDFFKEHLFWVLEGIRQGSNCTGYHIWTFVDNWSFTNAFKNRYGLISCDLKTMERSFKRSAYWLKEVLQTREFEKID